MPGLRSEGLALQTPATVATDFDAVRQRRLLAEELLESDNRYFEMGAETRRVNGARLIWVPGCAAIPPGCLILRVEAPPTLAAAHRRLTEFEHVVHQAGGGLVRLYLQLAAPVLVEALAGAGYEEKAEVAFLSPQAGAPPLSPVTLRPVQTRTEWERKCAVDNESEVGPDGYAPDRGLWHELLRRKWETGCLRFYFIERNGEICGTVGSIAMAHVLRLKNLVIRPAHRNRGVGRQTVHAIWQMAHERGLALGVFAVAGDIGFATYRSAGLEPAGAQYEWTKPLSR